jgi:hypothetical protein
MRKVITALLLAIALPVAAQAQSKPEAQPLPPPPPPPGSEPDPLLEPQVTIIKRGADTIEEFRVGGKLYMVKVTPPHGRPYYLIDERGDGRFTRQDGLDSGIRPPLWVIREF